MFSAINAQVSFPSMPHTLINNYLEAEQLTTCVCVLNKKRVNVVMAKLLLSKR